MTFKGLVKGGINHAVGKTILTGVPAIIKNPKGEILLGKRSKSILYYPNMWGLPGGLIEFGETIEDAIKRELKEELGVNSEITKYGKPFMQMPVEECPIQSLNIVVYCKLLETPKPKDETSEVRWFAPEEIRKMNLAYDHKKILKQEKII